MSRVGFWAVLMLTVPMVATVLIAGILAVHASRALLRARRRARARRAHRRPNRRHIHA